LTRATAAAALLEVEGASKQVVLELLTDPVVAMLTKVLVP